MQRGKVISLISGSSGKPKYVVVKRESNCSRCKIPINSGDKCAEIPKLGGAYPNRKRYCLNCFILIIKQTDSDLNKIKQELKLAQDS